NRSRTIGNDVRLCRFSADAIRVALPDWPPGLSWSRLAGDGCATDCGHFDLSICTRTTWSWVQSHSCSNRLIAIAFLRAACGWAGDINQQRVDLQFGALAT